MKKIIFILVSSLAVMTFPSFGQNCSGTATLNVTISPALTINGNVTNGGCGGALGAIALDVTGSTLPYTYLWSNGATTEDISNLTAGNYTVTVTGNNGCSETESFVVSTSGGAAPSLTGSVTNAGCGTGEITVSASGGSEPYGYMWSNGGQTATISNLSAGNYTVTVSSNGGCTSTASYAVTTAIPVPVIISTSRTCNSITFTWSGPNTGTYEVRYKVGTTASPVVNVGNNHTHTFTGLAQNTKYKVFVRHRCPNGQRGAWAQAVIKTLICFGEPGTNDIQLNTVPNGDVSLALFPNPASDEVNIVFQSQSSKKSTLFLQNAAGQWIQTIENIPHQGEIYRLDTRNLTPGFYWITVRQGDRIKTEKLVIED